MQTDQRRAATDLPATQVRLQTTHTLPDVASWAGGTDPAATVRATAERVVRAARTILDDLPTDHGPGGQPPGIDRALHAHRASSPARPAPVAAQPAGVGVAR